ncbi:DNA/RNA polymerase, partial [Piedraia hortae CBS 480.64]
YAFAYLDDIMIHSSTQDDHFKHVALVKHTLAAALIHISSAISIFNQSQIKYLGYHVGHQTISPDTDHFALPSWPPPTRKVELQQFLGTINWFRPFIPRLASLAAPLCQLTGNTTFQWT